MTKTKRTSTTSVRTKEQVDAIVSSIGPKMKMLRQEQRLSLQQLAVKAEVSAAAIHKMERNDMVPTITTLLKVAAALDRPVTFFVEQDGEQPDPVAFTPASDRLAVCTPHAGLTLAGVSGPTPRSAVQRRSPLSLPAQAVATSHSSMPGRSWSSCSRAP